MSRYNSMSKKVDLNKLSPQELLAYAQNLVKQTEKVKQQPKPKTIKPVKSITTKASTKLSQILSSSGKVLNYPKEIVSIAQMRDEELNMTSAPGKLKLTFAELFERRLKTMPGKKTKIQITVLAGVRYTIGSTSELESKEWGPFHISIPKLTKSDMYKLFIYILLTNGFSILSTQTIEEVGAKIITHKKSFFKDHKMGRLKLESFFLDSRKKLKVRDNYTCVIDYIWNEIQNVRGFKKYAYESLADELADYSTARPFMSTQEIVNWVKEHHPNNISVHAYTATYSKFMSYICHAPDVVLLFFVKDHHVHPITDPELKKVASSKNQIGTVNLFEHMSELKWTRRRDKFTMYDDLTPETQNNIIVCPEDLDARTAICQYMQILNFRLLC